MTTLTIASNQVVEIIDISRAIREAVSESGVRDGLAVVYTPHTTAAITINENADPDVARDMVMALNKLAPLRDGYHHAEGNSAAHIKSSLIGASATLIIRAGQPVLGTWQGVFFCEFDGPRQRQVHLKIIGG